MIDNIIDSSAWIEYFKGNLDYYFIGDLICNNVVCTNEIIVTELLPSIIHRKENHLANLLNKVRKYPLIIDWQEVRDIQLLNLKHGNNNVGVSDIVIAQNCIQNNLRLITKDKHFSMMSEYMPLKL